MSTPKSGVVCQLWKDGTMLQSTYTNESGVATFNSVPVGVGYYVKFTKPVGYALAVGHVENLVNDRLSGGVIINRPLGEATPLGETINTMYQDTGYGYIAGIDTHKDKISTATAIISQAISVYMEITANVGGIVHVKLRSNSVVSELVTFAMTSVVVSNVANPLGTALTDQESTVLIIAQGGLDSALTPIPYVLFGTATPFEAAGNTDEYVYIVGSTVTPGRVVVAPLANNGQIPMPG